MVNPLSSLKPIQNLFSVLVFSAFCFSINAQSLTDSDTPTFDKTSVGFGGGMDFGGLGANLTVYPTRRLGIFGGVGYAFAGIGVNGGFKLRFAPDESENKAHFFLMGMYGYNAAVAVTNRTDLNKLFYGPTFGIGVDFARRYYKKGYWTLALCIPVRSPDVDYYMNTLRNVYGVDFKNGLTPVTVSVGYRIVLK